MARDLAADDEPLVEPAWDAIQSALEDIARLSMTAIARTDFHAAVIARAAHTAEALAGAVWLRSAEGEWTLDANCLVADMNLDKAWPSPDVHEQMFAAVTVAGAATSVAPGHALGDDPRLIHSGAYPLILAPLRLGAHGLGVIELLEPATSTLSTLDNHLQFLSAIAELTADYHRQQQLREFALREGVWRSLEQFIEHAHGSLDLRATTYAIANEGRRLVDCDRLSVATRDTRGKCRLMAISGAESFERRSAAVRALEQLGDRVAQVGEPLCYPAAAGSLPPEIERAVNAWLDESHARGLTVIPLRRNRWDAERAEHERQGNPAPPPTRENLPIGLLFIEQFRSPSLEEAGQQRVTALARHASSALANALDYESLPLLPLERALLGVGWLTRARQLPKAVLAIVGAALLGLGLALIPADFSVEARGELQPQHRRQIFVPDDGIVSATPVAAGESVRAGDVLLTLRKPSLEFELSRVLGETQTAKKRLSAVQAARLGTDRGKTDTPEHLNQLSAEEEEIKATLASLQAQEAVLREEQAALAVRSPIDGTTLAWNLQQLLEARPVERGKILLEVGDLKGPWELVLRLPDQYAGYVHDARQAAQPDLAVDYLLATDPGETYRGHVQDVSLAATADELYGPHVRLTARLDGETPAERRPGATVIAKIHCGRRAIGFVWFHDLISAIRAHVLF